jgi:hypothetical protein
LRTPQKRESIGTVIVTETMPIASTHLQTTVKGILIQARKICVDLLLLVVIDRRPVSTDRQFVFTYSPEMN